MGKNKGGLQFDLEDKEAMQAIRMLANNIIAKNSGEDAGTMMIACLDVCIRMVKGSNKGMTTVDAIERMMQVLFTIAQNEREGKTLKRPVSG